MPKLLFIKEQRTCTGLEGTATYLYNLASELKKRNIEYLILYNQYDRFYQYLLDNNINVKLVKFPDFYFISSIKKILYYVIFKRQLFDFIKKNKFTHICCQATWLYSYLKSSKNYKICMHEHAAFSTKPKFRDYINKYSLKNGFYIFLHKQFIYNCFFQNVDHFICATESSANTINEFYNYPKDKVFVLDYGVPRPKCLIPSLKDNSKLIICVGRLTKVKGVEDFCKIAQQASTIYKNLKFVFIGDSPAPNCKYSNDLISKYSDYVEFTGRLSDLSFYYSNAFIHLFLSHREGGGMVIFESFSYGLPCIVWDVVGVRDVVNNCCNGFVVDKGNYNKILMLIGSLLDNSSKYGYLKKNALDTYNNKHSLEKHVDKFLSIICST